jgi:hypothetical protein
MTGPCCGLFEQQKALGGTRVDRLGLRLMTLLGWWPRRAGAAGRQRRPPEGQVHAVLAELGGALPRLPVPAGAGPSPRGRARVFKLGTARGGFDQLLVPALHVLEAVCAATGPAQP